MFSTLALDPGNENENSVSRGNTFKLQLVFLFTLFSMTFHFFSIVIPSSNSFSRALTASFTIENSSKRTPVSIGFF